MKLLNWLYRRKPKQVLPRQFLAEAQRQNPPARTGADDLGSRIYARLAPRLSPEMRNLFSQGEAVVGEVGILEPNAFTEFVPPRGYAISLYTGMGNLFHTVSRIILTSATWGGSGSEQRSGGGYGPDRAPLSRPNPRQAH